MDASWLSDVICAPHYLNAVGRTRFASQSSEIHSPTAANGRCCCEVTALDREMIFIVVDGGEALGTEMLPLSKFLRVNAEYRVSALCDGEEKSIWAGRLLLALADQIVRMPRSERLFAGAAMEGKSLYASVNTTGAQLCTGFERARDAHKANSKTRASISICLRSGNLSKLSGVRKNIARRTTWSKATTQFWV
ncbi:hypothetical protein [Hyphomicrobium methylovorum]|uniref:hypothetical protein n=1 Tax=Hyphomicrobium methylovorum TaxID=84 RepID=UPI0015E63121|nr:hypothetical protein [Hyphomicrobium methylovorum]